MGNGLFRFTYHVEPEEFRPSVVATDGIPKADPGTKEKYLLGEMCVR